jgi:hypothetical protein
MRAMLTTCAVAGAVLLFWSGPALGALATAEVNGTETPVQAGSVIAQGVPDGGGNCVFSSPARIQGYPSDAAGADGVDAATRMDDSCRLVVASVTEIAPSSNTRPDDSGTFDVDTSPAADPPGSGVGETPYTPVNHRGWAKNTITEQFGVTATEVYVQMDYTRNGGSVYNGRSPAQRDYHSHIPCWVTTNLSYTWSPYGPTYIDIYRKTHFHNSCTAIDYTITAKFYANPDPHFRCTMPQGSIPGIWRMNCAGGIYY